MSSSTSAAAALLLAVLTVPMARASETLHLEPGMPATGMLQSDEVHVYEAHLPAGKSWFLAVTAEGNRALVSVHGVTNGEKSTPRLIGTNSLWFGLDRGPDVHGRALWAATRASPASRCAL